MFVFDKSVFPLSEHHSNANAQLQAEVLRLPTTLLNHVPFAYGGDLPIDHMVVSNSDNKNLA
jgi:hypothetical protein